MNDKAVTLGGGTRVERIPWDSRLRIEDSGVSVDVWGANPQLQWLTNQIEAVEHRGTAADVPDALFGVAQRDRLREE